ncbi:MAG: hypothetical protein LBK60_11990 [Verrucomicrobiales bacterium]|jgi:hypothetical protein|nr:hypothetical protein [Verrucomicrobiales bacterium]
MNKPTALLALLLSASALAQADELVKFPVLAAAWDVQVSPSKFITGGTAANRKDTPASVRSGPRLTAVTVAQDGCKRRYQVTYSNGATRETWELPSRALTMAETPGGTITTSGLSAASTPFGPAAFDWLKPECRKNQKPTVFQGKPCWHYESTRETRNDQGAVIARYPCAAWIDAATLLPVALDDGIDYGSFKFRDQTTLTLPEKFQQKLDRYRLFNTPPNPKKH